jgi:hypothetical protein
MVGTEAKTDRLVEKIKLDGDFTESNLLSSPAELAARLKQDGYLFFRGLMNPDGLLQVRRDILTLCKEHGWLDAAAPLMDGIYSGIPFPDYTREYMPLYRKLLKLESFNHFSKSAEIVSLFARVLQSEILVHPRNISRISFPRHYSFTTQPHQDFFYIRGTPETYTAWIPAGDCPRDLGGLALVEGSHKLGFLKHEPAIGAGGNGVKTENIGRRWLSTDYRAGDVVIMHSHTVHGALDNHTERRLRISLDYRYQRAQDEVDPSSLKPHYG